ncbi:hypothetical protein PSI23_21835, partial [Xenorhabdus sp. XENO-10]|nr:hypothetical protein [Xenorhabdus yunnanensis]
NKKGFVSFLSIRSKEIAEPSETKTGLINPTIRTFEMTEKEQNLAELKRIAYEKHQAALTAWHEYACACDLGNERIAAFERYENIRLALRIG